MGEDKKCAIKWTRRDEQFSQVVGPLIKGLQRAERMALLHPRKESVWILRSDERLLQLKRVANLEKQDSKEQILAMCIYSCSLERKTKFGLCKLFASGQIFLCCKAEIIYLGPSKSS